jgi:hypothetical protein
MSEAEVGREITISDLETGQIDLSLPPLHSPLLTLSPSAPLPHKNYQIKQENWRERAHSEPGPIIPLSTHSPGSIDHPRPLTTDFRLKFKETLAPYRSLSVKLFYCRICFENHAEKDAIIVNSCENRHQFCKSCIQSLLRIQINDGYIKFSCPLVGECHGHFTHEEILSLLEDNEIKTKYIRFYEMKTDPNYRECPQCHRTQIGDPNIWDTTCIHCSYKYCFYHSNAHPNMNCIEYNRQQMEVEKESLRAIKSITRKCPSCQIPTEKNGGCNHMTCRQCGEVSRQS